MIKLRTLGGVDLRSAQGFRIATVLRQPKRLALLSYLAITSRSGGQRRDTLLGLFWPELDQDHAANALSQALRFLRHAVGEEVLNSRGMDEVWIDEAKLWCDAVAFEGAVERGDFAEALALYRGELLAGLHVPEAPEFERWLEVERARLRGRTREAAATLADAAETAGDLQQAAHWLRKAADIGSYDEVFLRRLLTVLDRVGDRAAALGAYQDFAQRVAQELDAEPAPETRALAEAIRTRTATEAAVPGGRAPEAATAPAAMGTPVGLAAAAVPAEVVPRRWASPRAIGLAALLVGATAVAVGLALVEPGSGSETTELAHIAVLPFRNETGDSPLDPLGRVAADWIAQGLVRTELVRVVMAESAGAVPAGRSALLSGAYSRHGDSLRFRARVEGPDGAVLGAMEATSSPGEDPLLAVERLRQRFMGLLALRHDPRLAQWAAETPDPPAYAAYSEHVAGLEKYSEGNHVTAAQHYERAAALDTSFLLPRLELASIYAFLPYQREDDQKADSLAELLQRSRARLPRAQRFHLDAVQAKLQNDPGGIYEAYRRAAEIAPERYRYEFAEAALWVGQYQQAVDALRRIEPERAIARNYWWAFASALHLLARHEEELLVARRARTPSFPRERLRYQARALAALGRMDELNTVLEENAKQAGGEWTSVGWMTWAGDELLIHGHRDLARQLYERGVAQWQFAAAERPGLRLAWVPQLYYRAGRLDTARALYQRRQTESLGGDSQAPGSPEALGGLAAVAARQGHRDEARRIARVLEEQWKRGDSGRVSALMSRANIAALLGEREQAVQLVRQALSEGMPHYSLHFQAVDLLALRGYPPFEALLQAAQ